MNYNRLVNLKGINYWYLATAIGLNLFWSLMLAVFVSILFIRQVEAGTATVQMIMILASFVGPFLVGWLIGNLAADGRAPTYGIYGSLGSIVILLVIALPTGLLGLMMVFAAVAGGLNGGLFSLRRRFHK